MKINHEFGGYESMPKKERYVYNIWIRINEMIRNIGRI